MAIFDMSQPYQKVGNLDPYIDAPSIHAYKEGRCPETTGWGAGGTGVQQGIRYATTDFVCADARQCSTEMPWVTEFGYGTDASAGASAVTPEVQMKYTLRTFLDNISRGIPRTYVYQFADQGTDGYQSYGLVDASANPKPAYRALATLIGLLSCNTQMSVPSMQPIITADPSLVRSLSIKLGDGATFVALWQPYEWFGQTVAPPPINVTLLSKAYYYAITQFAADGTPSTTWFSGGGSIPVTDGVTIVELIP